MTPDETGPDLRSRRPRSGKPHLLYVAVGFPPAAKSGAHRMLAMANEWVRQGWDVTVLTISRTSWQREFGLDLTLERQVDPTVQIVELPLARVDLETDLEQWSWLRARFPQRWVLTWQRLQKLRFPEPVFGGWARPLAAGALAVHARRPVDLAIVSPTPYAQLAAAWALRAAGVPYVVDFRDSWSLDVIGGAPAFPLTSRRGRWEAKIVRAAEEVWVVNDPIREHYAQRYPEVAARFRTVRNGYDEGFVRSVTPRTPDPEQGLTFGYVGTATLPAALFKDLLTGWVSARASDPVLARSRLVFYGHFGAGHARSANGYVQLIAKYAQHGVSYSGPVLRGELAALYSTFDALVMAIIGGKHMTSGKVYEYAATGLPILSVHAWEHDAATVLADYPLWVRPPSLSAAEIAKGFTETARLAVESTPEDRAKAREVASRFERNRLVVPPITELSSRFTGGTSPSARTASASAAAVSPTPPTVTT